MDLPPPPLFRDELKESIIPQVPLMQILAKFDGITSQEVKTYKENFMKKYELVKLPKYLVMCFRVLFLPLAFRLLFSLLLPFLQRFTKNTFYMEKNPTIVNFQIK